MNKKKKDYLIITLGFQFLICALLFGLLFGLKTTNSDFLKSLGKDYFNNLNENFTFETVKREVSEQEFIDESVENIKTDVEEAQSQTTTATPTTTESSLLEAEIEAEGGADYSVSSENDLPSNVSVNNYSLNQRMVLPVSGTVTSEFGLRNHPISGDLRFHAGIDIAADTGTPIYAAFDGVVKVAEYDQWNGYHIKIAHDSDILTVYCHCSELFVKVGDTVSAGDIIAAVGSTGSSTGPHLHFEFRIDNVSYNPETALNEAINAV